MEIKNAKIVQIGELKEFANDFKVVEFVVETNEQYPQFITLQCVKEKAENLLKYSKVGDLVDCSINLRGRKYEKDGETRFFNSIEAWKVFKSEVANPEGLAHAKQVIDGIMPAAEDSKQDDDLPF